MEVHHHAHIPTSREKKWTHYFWEFLMLFLAVFCGFLAEYQLEHKIEKDREKQYIKSLMRNLYDDTTSINFVEKVVASKVNFLDSLLSIRYDDLNDNANRELFYYYIKRSLFSNIYFQSNDATLIQLRNSGGLRLIKATGAADSISVYQQNIDKTMAQREAMDRYFSKATILMERLIDITIMFDTVYFNEGWFTGKSRLPVNFDKQLLMEFFNVIQNYKLISFYYNNFYLKNDKGDIKQLVQFLKNTYHLEE